MTSPRKAIGYLRVSTDEQGASGLGLEAQEHHIRGELDRRGWELVELRTDIASGKRGAKRPELDAALAALDAGEASVLIVAKVDRLSRSILDFANLVERSKRRGWAIVVLGLADTTTATGRGSLNILMAFAEMERELIAERTSEAAQAAKRRGARLGRPVELANDVRHRIAQLRAGGMSLRAIARELNDDGTPTARGGPWTPWSVRAVVASVELDAEAARLAAEAERIRASA